MPTGYTASIISEEGIEFKDFVMTCARAFGVCVEMRDEGMDAKIPEEFKVSDYHSNKLKEIQEKLNNFKKLSLIDYEGEAKKLYDKQIIDYEKSKNKNIINSNRYKSMLEKVKNWKVPSPNHVELKKFMINQIEESVKFDLHEPDLPKLLTKEEWMNKELAKIEWDLNYHTKSLEEEIERVKSRNKWIKQLRESLI